MRCCFHVLTIAFLAGLALHGQDPSASSQVLVYKLRQKQVVNSHRLSTSSWESRQLPANAYLVVEVDTVTSPGTIVAAAILSYWSDGTDKLYQVTDPTAENLAFLRLGGTNRSLLWNTETRKAVCYGTAKGSTVILASAYTGCSVEITEQAYGNTTRVASVTAAVLSLRLDKGMSSQADIVHDVTSFVQALVAGLEAKGYTDADADR